MVVLVLPMPNLQQRDPTVMARTGAKGRQDGDGSASKDVSPLERGTLSQRPLHSYQGCSALSLPFFQGAFAPLPVPKTVSNSAHPSPILPLLIHGTHLQKGSQDSQAIWVNLCLCKAVILGVVVDHVDLEGKYAIPVLDGHHWEMLTPTGLQPADARAVRDMQM